MCAARRNDQVRTYIVRTSSERSGKHTVHTDCSNTIKYTTNAQRERNNRFQDQQLGLSQSVILTFAKTKVENFSFGPKLNLNGENLVL